MRHPPLPLTRGFSDHKWLWLWSYHCIPWLSIRIMDPRFPGPKMLGLRYYPEISWTQNVRLGLGVRDFPDQKSVRVTVLSRNFLDQKCWFLRGRDPRFPGPKMLGLRYYPEISRTKNVGLLGLEIRDFPDPKC